MKKVIPAQPGHLAGNGPLVLNRMKDDATRVADEIKKRQRAAVRKAKRLAGAAV
jgi:hypothetical protein